MGQQVEGAGPEQCCCAKEGFCLGEGWGGIPPTGGQLMRPRRVASGRNDDIIALYGVWM